MKYIFFLLLLCGRTGYGQRSFYTVQVADEKQQPINLAGFKDRRVLIACASPETLQNGMLEFLDSLKAVRPDLIVLVVPAKDYGGERNGQILSSLKSNAAKKVIVADASTVKKSAKSEQSPLMQWLTNSSENRHFDAEVESDGQLYVVSRSGKLYAVLTREVSSKILSRILEQEDLRF